MRKLLFFFFLFFLLSVSFSEGFDMAFFKKLKCYQAKILFLFAKIDWNDVVAICDKDYSYLREKYFSAKGSSEKKEEKELKEEKEFCSEPDRKIVRNMDGGISIMFIDGEYSLNRLCKDIKEYVDRTGLIIDAMFLTKKYIKIAPACWTLDIISKKSKYLKKPYLPPNTSGHERHIHIRLSEKYYKKDRSVSLHSDVCKNKKRCYGTKEMIDFVNCMAKRGWVIGDISKKGGGQLSGHNSHRKGIDVDVFWDYQIPSDRGVAIPIIRRLRTLKRNSSIIKKYE